MAYSTNPDLPKAKAIAMQLLVHDKGKAVRPPTERYYVKWFDVSDFPCELPPVILTFGFRSKFKPTSHDQRKSRPCGRHFLWSKSSDGY